MSVVAYKLMKMGLADVEYHNQVSNEGDDRYEVRRVVYVDEIIEGYHKLGGIMLRAEHVEGLNRFCFQF